jgi:hypothetical protein
MHAAFFSLSLFFWMHCPTRVLPCVLLQHCSLFFRAQVNWVRSAGQPFLIIDFGPLNLPWPNQTEEFHRISPSPSFSTCCYRSQTRPLNFCGSLVPSSFSISICCHRSQTKTLREVCRESFIILSYLKGGIRNALPSTLV